MSSIAKAQDNAVNARGSGIVKRRRRRRRQRSLSLNAEIRQSAKQIYETGMAEAIKVATLAIVSRKLDEIRTIVNLVANGFGNGPPLSRDSPSLAVSSLPSPPSTSQQPPVVKNPCVHCGREGVYRTRPNQWNKSGSWFCRVHMSLGAGVEAEDRMDRTINPVPPSAAAAPAVPPQPVPGASTLAEAMGIAEIVDES